MSVGGERVKIRLAGSGGQGIILASIVLAEASGIYDDRYVVQSQSYGPEARGGNCKAEVVVSNHPIDFPKAINLDILLALNQASLDQYYYDLKPDGVLIVNTDSCRQLPVSSAYQLPMATLAREKVGLIQTMNILSLGALAAITGIVSSKALREAVKTRAPKGTEEINMTAVDIGLREGKKAFEKMNRKRHEKISRLIQM